MNIQDFIAQLQSPNNQMTNSLRSGVNQQVASGNQNMVNYGSQQGWGGRSGLLGKLQGYNVNSGNQAIATGVGDLEKTRVGQLGNAVQFQDQQALAKEQMAQQMQMFLQDMAFKQKALDASQQFDWGNVLQGLFSGVGSMAGGTNLFGLLGGKDGP